MSFGQREGHSMKRLGTSASILVIVAAILAGCSSSTTASSTTTGAVPKTSTTSAASGAVGTAKWVESNGKLVVTMGGDVGSLASSLPGAISSHNPSSVSAPCQKLASDVTQAQAVPPIPNSKVQQKWSSALTDLSKAAQDCNNGVSQNSTDLLSKASSGITNGSNSLNSVKQSLGL